MSENTEKVKNDIGEHSFLMDINIIEAPLFTFKQNKSVKKMIDWEQDPQVSPLAKRIMKRYSNISKDTQMEYMRWQDSKGLEREFCVMSPQALPSGFDMDVFYALVSLLIKQEAPIVFNEEKEAYELKNDTLQCKISDITNFLGFSKCGKNNERIKDSIDRLRSASYYSLGSGVLFDGKTKQYVTNEISESLVEKFEYKGRGKQIFGDDIQGSVRVQINRMIIANIKYSFFKFLNNRDYFSLGTGLPRRLYSYIESNKYTSKGTKQYIKRKLEVLKHKIPLDMKYNSRLKKRLEKPLEALIEHGVIKGYFYGDEIFINGVKEETIYIYFKGTQAELIKKLTKDTKPKPKAILSTDKEQNLENTEQLTFPNDLCQEMKEIGINEDKINSIIKTYGKYKVAEHLLWVKEVIAENKAKNPSGLFIFSLNNVRVETSHPHISKFIKEYKKEIENKNTVDLEIIKKEYEEYIQRELDLFLQEDDFMYDTISNSVLLELQELAKERIKKTQMMFNLAEKDEDKEKLLKQLEEWKTFNIKREKSVLYKEEFNKRFRLYRNVKDFEQFKIEYTKNNK